MRKKLSVLLLLVFTLSLVVPIGLVSAKKPLIGDMDLQFNLDWPGPQTIIPEWVGTITINGEEYGMAFFNIGTGKPFDLQNNGSPLFFEEVWVIYDVGDYDFAFDENGVLTKFEFGDIVLWGYDAGLTNLKNSIYHMVGNVEEANDPFSNWIGRSVHMSGDIIWYPFGAPYQAPGIFRIN